MMGGAAWEGEAENWVRWVRTPGHDDYWFYRDSFFDAIVPPAGSRTLEVGCGEGRVARDLRERGHRVTGLDASPSLVRAAQEADPKGRYLVADAAELPFSDRSFEVVVAYNSLMDIEDMPGAVREASRVLQPNGTFCVCVTHPIGDAGRFGTSEPDAPFLIEDTYLGGRRRFEGTSERAGLTMTFRGWSYSLESYASALENAGFVIDRLREPAASERSIATFGTSEIRWRRIPRFLHIRARSAAGAHHHG
jgi:SAM-dependent methyltransferase